MANWSDIFAELFPETYANKAGDWWWQEMNIMYDLNLSSRTDQRVSELPNWQQELVKWSKRTDPYGRATRERCERIVTLLVEYKLRNG